MGVRNNVALLLAGFLLTFAAAASGSDSDLAGTGDALVRDQLQSTSAPGAVLVVVEGDAIVLGQPSTSRISSGVSRSTSARPMSRSTTNPSFSPRTFLSTERARR